MVGAFIIFAGFLIFVTRAPGVVAPSAYRDFVLGLLDRKPYIFQWIGRGMFIYVGTFVYVTCTTASRLDHLRIIVAIVLQIAFITAGLFLQFPQVLKEMFESVYPEDPLMARLVLFLACALGFFIAAYGLAIL